MNGCETIWLQLQHEWNQKVPPNITAVTSRSVAKMGRQHFPFSFDLVLVILRFQEETKAVKRLSAAHRSRIGVMEFFPSQLEFLGESPGKAELTEKKWPKLHHDFRSLLHQGNFLKQHPKGLLLLAWRPSPTYHGALPVAHLTNGRRKNCVEHMTCSLKMVGLEMSHAFGLMFTLCFEDTQFVWHFLICLESIIGKKLTLKQF